MAEPLLSIDSKTFQDATREFADHLENISNDLTQIINTDGPEKQALINSLFRSVHSIKGAAGFVGMDQACDVAHAMEALLNKARDKQIEIADDHVDLLYEAKELLARLINSPGTLRDEKIDDIVGALTELTNISGEDEKKLHEIHEDTVKKIFAITDADFQKLKEDHSYIYKIDVDYLNDLISGTSVATDYMSTLESFGELAGIFPAKEDSTAIPGWTGKISILFATLLDPAFIEGIADVSPDQISIVTSKSQELEPASPLQDQTDKRTKNTFILDETLKVNVAQLNAILDQTGMLVLTRNLLLNQCGQQQKQNPEINEILKTLSKITTELQQSIMKTRLQSLGPAFSKVPWMLRDLAKKLGKKINFQLDGEAIELDKSIIENLNDPITHLIRNVVDHGIEAPETRVAAGKKAEGQIQIKAHQEGGYVYIEIIDDGQGIDPEVIARKAVEKGLITDEHANHLCEKDKLKLIFLPGFSTREDVTEISGRGVGMDVVKTNIEKLGGAVEVESLSGKGTTMRLILPVTMTILQGHIVSAGGTKFIIPQANIASLLRIKSCDINQYISKKDEFSTLHFKSFHVPLLELKHLLNLNLETTNEESHILILKVGKTKYALIVDEILGSEEIVVKSKPVNLAEIEWMAGSAILSDGQIALIIDAAKLALKAKLNVYNEETLAGENQKTNERSRQQNLQPFIFFNIGTAKTYCMHLSGVSRIEKLDSPILAINKEGTEISVKGINYKLILPEKLFDDELTDQAPGREILIIPTFQTEPVAILIKTIQDIQEHDFVNITKNNHSNIFAKTIINEEEIQLIATDFAGSEKTQKARNNPSITVLLVEESPYFSALIQAYLHEQNIVVYPTDKPLVAIQLIEQIKPDLILTCMNMLELNGIEFASIIKFKKNERNIPIIALITNNESRFAKNKDFNIFSDSVLKTHKDALISSINRIFGGLSNGE